MIYHDLAYMIMVIMAYLAGARPAKRPPTALPSTASRGARPRSSRTTQPYGSSWRLTAPRHEQLLGLS